MVRPRRIAMAVLALLISAVIPLVTAAPASAAGHAADLGEDVRAFGGAHFFGSSASLDLNAPIVGMARTTTGNGYWEVGADGGIFTFGDAGFFGSTGGSHLNAPIVGIAATPTGGGYWFVARDGGVFSFGDARFFGSTGGVHLNQPVVGMAATPTGHGYWLVASDGGIFTFGDAGFFGSTGGVQLNEPVTGMAATPSGGGYWLVAADGGIFTFGDATFKGSATPFHPAGRVVGMAPTPTGAGYWLASADGGVFTFGDAGFFGSPAASPLFQPAVGIASTPTGDGYWVVLSGSCLAGSLGTKSASPGSAATSLLATVDVRGQSTCDIVRFGFRPGGPNPAGFTVGYERPPFTGPSGRAIPVRGNAFLVVRISPAAAHDDSGAPTLTSPTDIVPAGTGHIREVRMIEDFEGVVRWVIGLDEVRPFAAFSPNAGALLVEVS